MDQELFEILVKTMAEHYEHEDMDTFEDNIKSSGFGEAYFGIARDDWDRIDVIQPIYFSTSLKNKGIKFFAEYYNGFQAPFCVCEWSGLIKDLEDILCKSSKELYDLYISHKNEYIRINREGEKIMSSSIEKLKEIACPTKEEKTMDFALTGDDIRIIYDALCARWKQYDRIENRLYENEDDYISPDGEHICNEISIAKMNLKETKYKFGKFLGYEGNE